MKTKVKLKSEHWWALQMQFSKNLRVLNLEMVVSVINKCRVPEMEK
jgi:hypothetical protein